MSEANLETDSTTTVNMDVEDTGTDVESTDTSEDNEVMDVLNYNDEGDSDTPAEPKQYKTAAELQAELKGAPAPETKPEPAPEAAPVEMKPEDAPKPAAEEPKPAVEAAPQTINYDEIRTDLRGRIAEQYQLSEEEADLIATDPAKVMPQLMAKAFVDVYEAVFHAVTRQLPTMISSTTNIQHTVKEREQSFYSAHPELQEYITQHPASTQQLAAIGAFWRQQNPDASVEQAIEGIGKMAKVMLGIEAQAATAAPTPAPAPKPKLPRVPAAAQSGGAPTAPNQPDGADDVMDIINFEASDY